MSELSTYPPEKEKGLEVGKSDSPNVDINEAIQITPPSASNEEEVAKEAPKEPVDLFEVWWDEPADQDPANPMNWPMSQKWTSIAVLSAITFLTFVPLPNISLIRS
jgi:hypothetical protein